MALRLQLLALTRARPVLRLPAAYHASQLVRCTHASTDHRQHGGLSSARRHAKAHDFVHTRDHATSPDAPIAIVIGWMGAKSRYLSKYVDYYHSKGAETIALVPRAQDVLMPSRGRQRTEAILDYMSAHNLHNRRLVFHCFSTGGYMYGLFLQSMAALRQRRPECATIESSVRGQVFDSVVDYGGIPFAMPIALFPDSPAKQALAQRSITAFLKAAKPVAEALKGASHVFHTNTIKSPSLWYYSHDDAMAPARDIEHVIGQWRSRGIECTAVAWDKSKHVTHMRMHPERYWGELDAFWARSVAPQA